MRARERQREREDTGNMWYLKLVTLGEKVGQTQVFNECVQMYHAGQEKQDMENHLEV